VTVAGALADVRRTLQAALAAIGRGDGASAALMVASARSQLGDIHERYTAAALARQRAALERAAADLAAAESDARRGAASAAASLTAWLASEPGWSRGVVTAAPRSLYDPTTLARAGR